jgi:D-alanine transfer protein
MRAQHLFSSFVALGVVVVALLLGVRHASALEDRYLHALRPLRFAQKNVGSALQALAFGQADLLPVYGSSELMSSDNSYLANRFFASYPTGFATFEVVQGGITSLTMAQALAAVAPQAAGRKVVISVTPTTFFLTLARPEFVAGNFSVLHAYELAFSPRVSYSTRQGLARRMLEYPDTLSGHLLLSFALRRLAENTPWSRALYDVVWPLGRLQALVLRLQDHWELLAFIRGQPALTDRVEREPAALDWAQLLATAERYGRTHSTNNPFGFDDGAWEREWRDNMARAHNTLTDAEFLQTLNQSKEWEDLDLLLSVVQELGMRPLILSRPINGTYWGYAGVSEDARQAYYDRLRELAARHGAPLVDFRNHDNDPYFSSDAASHPSRKGWVYVDRVLDAFYHGELPPLDDPRQIEQLLAPGPQ